MIEVLEYNPYWKTEFENLKEIYLDVLKGINIKIEHVGSTSVPSLFAKPIIDIDVIVNNDNDKLKVINKLKFIGYNHLGDLGIKDREAFKANKFDVPYNDGKQLRFRHNLYVCKKGIVPLQNHLMLKKHLLNNPIAVKEYSALKLQLAKKYSNDIDKYVEGKTEFITNILNKMGMDMSNINDISNQNKVSKWTKNATIQKTAYLKQKKSYL